ncbi:hypothetical protein JRO89_XS03G0331300 [Xanthoceras sorbifolium]|uniref:Pectinesterase catalytic domain-containing protein n=1 Tax=Xanthoceras sorbifolium TaxID=99658 RepID=A0ABQ8IDN5_9ROSI|nr:hypothetical protein JRO89_XS03G0331300 [Xanthoceras sorbifolium]
MEREKKNVVIFGDGINNTIITFDKSHSSGVKTQESATLNVDSSHFFATDISIINSAGPKGEQAVALRTAGDYMACYRCSIEGYQDTLYVHLIIQNSIINVRLPNEGQQNVLTAQGREENNIDSAIVIHNCTIIPTPELASKFDVKTYLGRPWKKFSRTIIMESNLDGFIDREGWMKFDEKSDLSTLYYAEYNNRGEGASTYGRVKWPGYHILNNSKDVEHFTVNEFIDGSEWLSVLGVPYVGGLIG